MLTDDQLNERFDALDTPEIGRARIRLIRNSLPSRVTRTNKMSGKSRYASLKMPFVTEGEANQTEYAAMVDWDHDLDTEEFYPQPPAINITHFVKTSSRRTTHPTTPDYFRITKTAFTFVECKKEDALLLLAKETPDRYQQQPDGTWRSPPAELAAAEFGCKFELRSSAQNNWTLLENVELLKEYYMDTPSQVSTEARRLLKERLGTAGWISAFDLIHHEPAIAADDLYLMLVRQEVFFPLQELRLTDQERALFFRDKTTYLAYSTFLSCKTRNQRSQSINIRLEGGEIFDWDGQLWKVINPGDDKITIQRLTADDKGANLAELSHEQILSLIRAERITPSQTPEVTADSDAERQLRKASPKTIKEANWKYEILFGTPDPKTNLLAGRKRRSRFYWLSAYNAAEAECGNGFVGLLNKRSGNRKPKTSVDTIKLALRIIKRDWETIRKKKRLTSYGKYSALARIKRGYPVLSYVSFCKLIKERAGFEQKKARDGEKAAYDLEPQYLELEYTTPRHGVRMWHIGHIDHTPLPLKFVHSELGTIVPTIWLTILTDAFTRKIVSYYLSFDEPSYRSCMMAIRDCVRRHNRVHQIIVCDQGPEFNSEYWELLLALLRITKKERRKGKPKEGSVCERIFRTTQEQFVNVLLGSTEIVERYFRSISPEVNPTKHATWTMNLFDTGFQAYLDKVYHQNHHAGLCCSPNEAEALSLRSHGSRSHLLIPYNSNFIAHSCPAVHRKTAKVTPQGIKVNYRWCKTEAFLLPGVLGTDVPARYDPFNSGIAWAFVHGEWRKCYSEFFAIFAGRSERAIRLASEQLRLESRVSGKKLFANAERLALFLIGNEANEAAANQARNDTEAQTHRAKINSNNRPTETSSISMAEQSTASTSAGKVKILEDL